MDRFNKSELFLVVVDYGNNPLSDFVFVNQGIAEKECAQLNETSQYPAKVFTLKDYINNERARASEITSYINSHKIYNN